MSMIDQQLIPRGIKDPLVLTAMGKVHREKFMNPASLSQAYYDGPVPIGYGQTISQPYIVALMTELMEISSTSKVLEVGTGSGYQAAILAEITSHVYTIEIVPELADQARSKLKELGYANVSCQTGDGYYGWPDKAPFDAIVVTAAPSTVPAPLIEQLKEGGRLIIPVGETAETQNLLQIRKKKDGSLTKRIVVPVRFVPFTGEHGQRP